MPLDAAKPRSSWEGTVLKLLALLASIPIGLLAIAMAFVPVFRACGVDAAPSGGGFLFGDKPTCKTSNHQINRDAASGSTDAVARLLGDGQSVSDRDSAGLTPIECSFGHATTMALLLEHGARLEPLDDPTSQALHQGERCFLRCAAAQLTDEDIQVLQVVLDHGADPNGLGHNPSPITLLASTSGRCGAPGSGESAPSQVMLAAALLLDHGAAPTPALGPAVSAGFEDLVGLLLDRGAEPNLGQPTPLVRAAYCDRRQALDELLRAGADPNLPSSLGLGGTFDAFQILIALPAPLNQVLRTDPSAPQPVMDDVGRSISTALFRTDSQLSALAAAIVSGHAQIATTLLRSGARVDVGFNEVPPLQIAVLLDNRDTCKLLVDHGANVTEPRGPLPSAIDLARWYHLTEALAALHSGR